MEAAGMRFDEGRGAFRSSRPPSLDPSNPLRNPVPRSETAKSQLFFLTKEDLEANNKWCLGLVGGSSGFRFCMGQRIPGSAHCGVSSHGNQGRSSRSKFHPQADCFYIPNGVVSSRPVARRKPCLHWEDVPSFDKNTFKNGQRKTADWVTKFEERLGELELAEAVAEEEEVMSGVTGPRDDSSASDEQEDDTSDVTIYDSFIYDREGNLVYEDNTDNDKGDDAEYDVAHPCIYDSGGNLVYEDDTDDNEVDGAEDEASWYRRYEVDHQVYVRIRRDGRQTEDN
jgi:hypothetical protein